MLNPDLQSAINVLFADQFLSVSNEPPCRIEMADIKREFRKKAMQYHPDRAALLGESRGLLEEKFKRISHAYGILKSELDDKVFILRPVAAEQKETLKEKKPPFNDFEYRRPFHHRAPKPDQAAKPSSYTFTRRRPPSSPRTAEKHFFFHGSLPRRPLRLGEFLFYNRIITWRTLIDAIVWQHRVRPRVGEIAVELKYLRPEDIFNVLRQKQFKEPFGRAAVRLGLIDNYRRLVLLGRQRGFNQPLGRFFIDSKILNDSVLDRFIQENRIHNFNFGNSPWRI